MTGPRKIVAKKVPELARIYLEQVKLTGFFFPQFFFPSLYLSEILEQPADNHLKQIHGPCVFSTNPYHFWQV